MRTDTSRCDLELRYLLVGLIPFMLLAVCIGVCHGASLSKVWLSADGDLVPGKATSRTVVATLDSTILSIDIPGVYLEEVGTPEGSYHRVEIPGGMSVERDGEPALAELVLRVACPEFEGVTIEPLMEAAQSFDDLELRPYVAESDAPQSRRGSEARLSTDDSHPIITGDPTDSVAGILRIGRIRDQKVIWVRVRPVRYDSENRRLVVNNRLRIALRYEGATASRAVWGTGPFDSICRRVLLGYEEMQSAPQFRLLGSGGGQVAWVSTLDSCVANNTDYLIVAASRFTSGTGHDAIDSLANLKAKSSGLNVSIIDVADIVTDVDVDTADVVLKEFIADLYESGSAAHWWDGHLGFVLLVGDHKSPGGTTLIPVHWVQSQYGEPHYPDTCASDSWYAAITDLMYPSLMLGRLAVDDSAEIWTVVNKIRSYEPLPDTASWPDSVFLVAGTVYKDNEDTEIPKVDKSFGIVEEIVKEAGYGVNTVRGDILCKYGSSSCPGSLEDSTMFYMNNGRAYVLYNIHGAVCELGYKNPRTLTYCGIDNLTNADKLSIFTAPASCMVCCFQEDSTCTGCGAEPYDGLGERLMHTDAGGAVAVIGNTAAGAMPQVGETDVDLYESLFTGRVPLLGEAFVEMMLKMSYHSETHFWLERAVILGDPALRIRYRESGVGKWDLLVRPDTNHIWFDPRIDTSTAPESTTISAIIRNVSGKALEIPDSLPAVEVQFWTNILEDSLKLLGTADIRTLAIWDTMVVATSFAVRDSLALGIHDFKVVIDGEEAYADSEGSRDNNEAVIEAYIGLPPSKGALGDKPSDCPTLAYLEKAPGSWEHYTLFPCKDSQLYAVTGSGFLTNYRFNAEDGALFSPAVYPGSDGRSLEIVASQHKVWCVDIFEPESLRIQWNRDLGDTVVLTPPCLADLDGDGDLEVVVGAANATADTGYIFRINGDNNGNFGDPVILGDSLLPTCPLAITDLNHDGNQDIVVGTDGNKLMAIDGLTGRKTGTRRVGNLGGSAGDVKAIVVGDLDLDGSVEIAAGCKTWLAVVAADSALTLRTRTNIYDWIEGLAIADVVDNADTLALELVADLKDVSVSVLNYRGEPDEAIVQQRKFEAPQGLQAVSRPVAGDVHPEPGLEVLFFGTQAMDQSTTMWMWNPDNDKIVGYSENYAGPVASAVLCDFNDDLEPEIVFADTTGAFWLVTGSRCGRRLQWPMAFGDERCRNIHSEVLGPGYLPTGNTQMWGNYLVTGSISFDGTGTDTLTMAHGVKISFVPDDSLPPTLGGGGPGLFIAEGKEYAPILLTSADPSPEPGGWGGLILPSGEDHMLNHVVVEYGTYGADIEGYSGWDSCSSMGNITLESCEFRYNEAWGIYGNPDKPGRDIVSADQCLFRNNGVGGVYLPFGSPRITWCQFLKVDSVSTGGQSAYGIKVGLNDCSGGCPFDSCHIESNTFDAGPSTDPDTSYWDYAIFLEGCSTGPGAVIRCNNIDSFFQTGILVRSLQRPATITHNNIETDVDEYESYAGIRFMEGTSGATDTAFAYSNIVIAAEYGVVSNCTPPPILGDSIRGFENTHLLENEIFVMNDVADTLKAEMCWWGSDDPDVTRMLGPVDYKPFLTSAPYSGARGDDPLAERLTYRLVGSLPNPTISSGAKIRFSIPERCDVLIEVYNVLGQRVKVLQSGKLDPGWHEAAWDLADTNSRRAAPGIYLCRMTTAKFSKTSKVVVLR